MNIATWSDENLRRTGDREELFAGSRWWSSAELHRDACRLASALIARGVRPGDRVLIVLPSGRDVMIAAAATWRCGAVVVYADPATPRAELDNMHALVEPAFTVTDDLSLDDVMAGHPPLDQPVDRVASDPAQLCFTGGTSGVTKAAIYTHGGIGALLAERLMPADAAPTRHLLALPPTAFGGTPLNLRWTGQRSLVALDRFEPRELLAAIARHRITHCLIVPTMGEALLAVDEIDTTDVSSLRQVTVAGSAGSPALFEQLARKLGVRPSNSYGMTELGASIALGPASDVPGVVAPLVRGLEVRVIDERGQELPRGEAGEIVARSPWMASGYWRDPEQTAATFRDGWVHTGDLGAIDDAGTLRLVGRSKEIIIQGGFNVSPQEVVDVVRALPGVADCAAIGVPHPLLGEEVVVCAVARDGADIAEAGVLAHCRLHLDPRKLPGRVQFIDAIPRTAAGKVKRGDLLARVTDATATPAVMPLASQLATAGEPERRALLLAEIRHQVGLVVPALAASLDPDVELTQLGLGSLDLSRVIRGLSHALGRALPPTTAFRYPTAAALAGFLISELQRAATEVLVLSATGVTERRASLGQQYFWYLSRQDPDPEAYATQSVMLLEGPLDRAALARSIEVMVGRHSVLRTAFRDEGGVLVQRIPDRAPFEVELIDGPPLPPDRWPEAIDRTVDQLRARGFDLEAGRCLRAAIAYLAPDRHALILLPHHIAIDAASSAPMVRHIFEAYRRLVAGEPASGDGPPPLQFIDYVESVERAEAGPRGEASRAFWRAQLADLPALEMVSDFPRDEIDAARAAAPLGITAEPMLYPYFFVELPAPVVAAVQERARAGSATSYMVYLASLAWLLHHRRRQRELCIESSFNPRAQHGVPDDAVGLYPSWMTVRIDATGVVSFDQLLGRTRAAVTDAQDHGAFAGYYDHVPPHARRATFNFVPIPAPAGRRELADGVWGTALPRPWPRWKRPWELHLTMLESPLTTHLFMTASSRLYRRDTISALLDRYVELLRDGV